MKKWKINQEIYHKLIINHEDNFYNTEGIEVVEEYDLVEGAVKYLTTDTNTMYYPGKSFAVALVYAKLLRDYFGEDFYEVLDDEALLFGNDPYFLRYRDKKKEYDEIITLLNGVDNIPTSGKWLDYTVKYFKMEMLGEGLEDVCLMN